MSTKRISRWAFLVAAGLLSAGVVSAQVPVDEDGNPLDAAALDEAAESQDLADDAPLLGDAELQELVGPIALYPDDLLAVVLPASAYPLQIVQAARFLDKVGDDDSLEPDPAWDESVVALLNYPEIIEMMNEDLDWTYALGEAVVRQQADVVAAIEAFRDRAYAAGNLKSDDRQTVTRDEGVIQIAPVREDVIYVPYYEPERVVVYQTRPVYHYYPQPYPVYYYPYPYGYSFTSGYFWGVTTAFRIGWFTDHLHVFHHSYRGHPYYGRHYYGHWYRNPSIRIYNRYYVDRHAHRPPHHERDGDFWRPRRHSGALIDRYRHRDSYYSDRRRAHSQEGYRNPRDVRPRLRGNAAATRGTSAGARFAGSRSNDGIRQDRSSRAAGQRQGGDAAIRFRAREGADVIRRDAGEDRAIRFRPRPEQNTGQVVPRTGREAAERVTRSGPRVQVERPSVDRSARPSIQERATSPANRVSPERRVEQAPRAAPAPSAAPAPRAAPTLRTAPAPRAAQAPRTAPAPRAVQQRAPAPSPRISAPRSSAPRATPAPRASRPSASSQRAPARASQAAPRREASSSGSRRPANRQ